MGHISDFPLSLLQRVHMAVGYINYYVNFVYFVNYYVNFVYFVNYYVNFVYFSHKT